MPSSHEYFYRGGAYGPSPDGTYTDGSVTGQPTVAAGALDGRITFLRGDEVFPCDLTLPLSPP